jgi:hypothetical protein
MPSSLLGSPELFFAVVLIGLVVLLYLILPKLDNTANAVTPPTPPQHETLEEVLTRTLAQGEAVERVLPRSGFVVVVVTNRRLVKFVTQSNRWRLEGSHLWRSISSIELSPARALSLEPAVVWAHLYGASDDDDFGIVVPKDQAEEIGEWLARYHTQIS